GRPSSARIVGRALAFLLLVNSPRLAGGFGRLLEKVGDHFPARKWARVEQKKPVWPAKSLLSCRPGTAFYRAEGHLITTVRVKSVLVRTRPVVCVPLKGLGLLSANRLRMAAKNRPERGVAVPGAP